jgi:transposase-like protein DUF772
LAAVLDSMHEQLAPYYSEIGRPSIDPELMVRVLIVGYCYGLRSERKLTQEVELHLAYRSAGSTLMTRFTTGNQAVILIHKWQGIASSIIGATYITITSVLFGTAMSATEPPWPISTALTVLSSGMLFANVIGIALGFFGAKIARRENSTRCSVLP